MMDSRVIRESMQGAHAVRLETLIRMLDTDLSHGLSQAEAKMRQFSFGPNVLREKPPEKWMMKLVRQFRSILIVILLGAALLSGAMGDWLETLVILAIVLINGGLGFYQEIRAESSLRSLAKLAAHKARVRRDGELIAGPASCLVPGDIIEVEAGDFVPADARLLEAFGLNTQEAQLTGESEPVEKSGGALHSMDQALAERSNIIYSGTTVVTGKARACVVATGMDTEVGRIAHLIEEQTPGPTPLQRRLAELGRVLLLICLLLVALIAAIYAWKGGDPKTVLLFAVSLAVAAIPEGLPAVVTVALALGLARMAKRNALIRYLPSVETLGSVNVICTDKTGTLTRNEMTVRRMAVGPRIYNVTGQGYRPKGAIELDDPAQVLTWNPTLDPDLRVALRIGALCNHASLVHSAAAGTWNVVGDPTEGALLVVALKAQLGEDQSRQSLVMELPFDSDRRMMTMIFRAERDGIMMMTKGAPEAVLRRCSFELFDAKIRPLNEDRRKQIIDLNQRFARQSMRTLGLAFREHSSVENQPGEEEMVFAGLVGMMDPPRQEAKDSIDRCRTAGIQVIMITGDHPETARAIAQDVQLTKEVLKVVTGEELDHWSEASWKELAPHVNVFARVTAEHKLRIVQAWRARGATVAMTGDGINDAPALKAADIGIAMGLTGSDVTKDVSAMVLVDDNFTSIVSAVEEGRGILNNIQNIIHYLLAGNMSELLLILTALLCQWPVPLLPVQILWINLVTDGIPALALASERPDESAMRMPPRPTREPIITWSLGLEVLRDGSLLALVMILGYGWAFYRNPDTRGDINQAQAFVFCICSFAQLAFAFGCRSRVQTLPELGAFTNVKLLATVLLSVILQLSLMMSPYGIVFFHEETPHFSPLSWIIITVLALTPVSVVELGKLLRKSMATSCRASYPGR